MGMYSENSRDGLELLDARQEQALVGDAIDLGQQQQSRRTHLADYIQRLRLVVRKRRGGIGQIKDDVAIFQRRSNRLHHALIQQSAGFVNARRIQKHDLCVF